MRSLAILVFAFIATTGAAHADTLVGRWCDQWIPVDPNSKSLIRIYETQTGSAYAQLVFYDGSEGRFPLNKSRKGEYRHVDSNTGDGYRIVGSGLEVFDNLGVIRVARRDAGSAASCAR